MSELFNKFLEDTANFLVEVEHYSSKLIGHINEYLASQAPPTEPVEPEPEPPIEPPVEPPVEPEPTAPYIELAYPPSANTQTIYVSSSEGSDNNDGLSADAPVRTVGRGIEKLRNGHPDHLLFKRGDVWDVGFGNLEKGGADEGEEMVFGSYGDITQPRPRFDTGASNGLNTFARGNPPREPTSIDYVAFVGLHFCANHRVVNSPSFDPESSPVGFRWLQGTQRLVIDDCKFEYYKTNIVIQTYLGSSINNVMLMNTSVLNAYSNSPNDGHSQGFYADGIHGLTIENCIFDNNGYYLDAPFSEPTIYNHNIYIQKNCSNVTVAENFISRASSHGCQLRPGGYAIDNFFYRNPIGLLIGYQDDSIFGEADGNVFADGTDIRHDLPRGWGIDFNNLNMAGVAVRDNVCANVLNPGVNSRGIDYESNITYVDNEVYNWPKNNELVDPDAEYADVNVNITRLGYNNADDLYAALRLHSMDNKKIFTHEFVMLYQNGFTRV